jgi:hypothetical protein
MCYTADGAVDADTAKPKLKSFGQCVYVVTVSNPYIHNCTENISTKVKKKH